MKKECLLKKAKLLLIKLSLSIKNIILSNCNMNNLGKSFLLEENDRFNMHRNKDGKLESPYQSLDFFI